MTSAEDGIAAAFLARRYGTPREEAYRYLDFQGAVHELAEGALGNVLGERFGGMWFTAGEGGQPWLLVSVVGYGDQAAAAAAAERAWRVLADAGLSAQAGFVAAACSERELDACSESLAEELREFNGAAGEVEGGARQILVAIGQRLAHGRPAVSVDLVRDLPALRSRVDAAVASCPRHVPIEVREVDAEDLQFFES